MLFLLSDLVIEPAKMRLLRSTQRLLRPFKLNNECLCERTMSVQTATKVEGEASSQEDKLDIEWNNAKPYEEIPGPGKWQFPLSFMPGGRYSGFGLVDIHYQMRKDYGDIFKTYGLLGRQDVVFTYNVDDIIKVYRNEGIWPQRIGLETFEYYRKKIRPDVFQGLGGLVTEQGQNWADVRYKVNPILMKIQTVRHHLPAIDAISKEFINRIAKIRNPETLEMPANFSDEIRKWAFESICAIALDKKLDLLTSDNPDPNVLKLVRAMNIFFQLSYEFDVQPSIWKHYKTPKFKKLMSTYDVITNITTSYINEAKEKFEDQSSTREAKSVLEQLFRVDKRIAVVMAIDMLMAGIDTTSSAFTFLLYNLAKNPEKQNRLRKEIMTILPDKSSPLTQENTKNMPYLRACLKESLRVYAITPGNFRGLQTDLVLSGYRVPKNTGVIMGVMILSNEDRYFPKSLEYMPERWLKHGEDACPAAKTNNPFVYLPFGFGPRTCIGKRIAEMEIETAIANIVRNYHVTWHYPEIKYVSNLINTPVGEMKFKFEDL